MMISNTRNRRHRPVQPVRAFDAGANDPTNLEAMDAYLDAASGLARLAAKARREQRNYFTPDEQDQLNELSRQAKRALGGIMVQALPVEDPS